MRWYPPWSPSYLHLPTPSASPRPRFSPTLKLYRLCRLSPCCRLISKREVVVRFWNWGVGCWRVEGFSLYYCWWFRNPVNSPVEVGSFSRYSKVFLHPRWCRISSIKRKNLFAATGSWHPLYSNVQLYIRIAKSVSNLTCSTSALGGVLLSDVKNLIVKSWGTFCFEVLLRAGAGIRAIVDLLFGFDTHRPGSTGRLFDEFCLKSRTWNDLKNKTLVNVFTIVSL